MTDENVGAKKRFSLRLKLLIIFGILIAVSIFALNFLAMRISQKAVIEKVEAHLIDKANDTAEIINGRIQAFFQFLEGIARTPVFADTALSYQEKVKLLKDEAAWHSNILLISIADSAGDLHTYGEKMVNVRDQEWFSAGMQGKSFVSEPFVSALNGQLIIVIATPLYDKEHRIIGVLNVTMNGLWLWDNIKDIKVGKTGECYILGPTGVTLADEDPDLIRNHENSIEAAKTDSALKNIAAFETQAIESIEPSIGFYKWRGKERIAAFAKIKSTGWTVIVYAPINDFLGSIQSLKISLYLVGSSILLIAFAIIFFMARTIVKPIVVTVNVLQKETGI